MPLTNIRRTAAHKPPFAVVYGTHGIGKTSLAASAPNPIFIQTEDGLGPIDADRYLPDPESDRLPKTLDEVMDAVQTLYEEKHDFQTVVLDSADHLEPLIWAAACKDNGWANIEAAGYGKGYVAALDHWRAVLDGFAMLRDDKNMGVVIIAHAAIQRFDSPETEPYDRYTIKLHKAASALLQERADLVMFNNYRVSTVKADVGFNKKATRAVGNGDRLIFTSERPAFLAKNRYSMPDQIALPDDPTAGWQEIAQHIPFYQTSAKEAA